MDEQSLQNVVVPAQMHPSHPSRFIQVRIHSFQFLSALAL
jgi:hypothetical protein